VTVSPGAAVSLSTDLSTSKIGAAGTQTTAVALSVFARVAVFRIR